MEETAKPAKRAKRKKSETKRPDFCYNASDQEEGLPILRLGLPGCLDDHQPAVRPNKRVCSAAAGSFLVCQVDGCRSDLAAAKAYHRRHKVCEQHSKATVVLLRKQMQRFCQQCSKFHPVAAFDDGKRSCRWRLDGHNRRRRKVPQDDASSSQLSRMGGAENWEANACSQSQILLSVSANRQVLQSDASSCILPSGDQEEEKAYASSCFLASDNRENGEYGDWEVANLLVGMSRGVADYRLPSV